VAYSGGHHTDRKPMSERDRGEVGPVRGNDRAGTDELKRFRAEEGPTARVNRRKQA
jgi:hypothetical protein